MDTNTPLNLYVPYTVTSIHSHIQIHIEIHWVYKFMYPLVSVIWIDGEGRMSEDGNGLRKAFWRLGRNESQVGIHQRHKKVIMGLWEWHLQLWGKKKVLQSTARKDRRLRLGGWQWYLSSKGMMQSGGFEPDRKPHHSLAEPRLGPGVNGLWEVLNENRILDGKRERMGEKSPGCGRETGPDPSEPRCSDGQSLHTLLLPSISPWLKQNPDTTSRYFLPCTHLFSDMCSNNAGSIPVLLGYHIIPQCHPNLWEAFTHPPNLAPPSELLPCHCMYPHEISSFYSSLYQCLC